jgi:ferrochelatase
MASDQIGVVLFNLGGPSDLSEVEPFLVRLFSDREIIELPGGAALQPLMARIIAKMRGRSVRDNYSRIGGGSPQLRITREQAKALEHRLNDLSGGSVHFHVLIAMRYSSPSSADALGQFAAADVRQIVTLSLFPHWSKATTGSSRNEFERTLAEPRFAGLNFDVTHVEHYADDPGYLDAFTDTVRTAFNRIPVTRRADTVILFSAHGLPQKFIDEGDPYVDHIEQTRAGILRRLNVPNRQLLAYQSRTGPVKWLGPGTEETIEQLGREGLKDLLIVPLSFVSDHIETLYEVDLLFEEAARHAGITGYFRPDALNCHPVFIDALAQMVLARTLVPA